MKIRRWYSAKTQLKQYEPIESGCDIEVTAKDGEEEIVSARLDAFCRSEVRKTIEAVKGASQRIVDSKKSKDVGELDAVEDLEAGIDDAP